MWKIMEKKCEFTTKIQNIGNGSRFQITVPKKEVESGNVDPEKYYRVILVQIDDGVEK